MSHYKDLTGQKFGRLKVLNRNGYRPIGRKKTLFCNWKCQCDCGIVLDVVSNALLTGHTKSCGCLRREMKFKHGHAPNKRPSPEHRTWTHMKCRCRPEAKEHHDYFDRGITVCEAWQNSFEAFVKDMGLKPSKDHSLDRIDNDKGYEPSNCRWATRQEQLANRRRIIKNWEVDELKTKLAQYEERFGTI